MLEPIIIKEIDLKRFNALAGQSRSPAAAYVSKELSWYANSDETILGVLLLDITDDDYAAVVLGRDEGNRFRCIDTGSSIETREEATTWLIGAMKWHTSTGKRIFPQGDRKAGVDLFTPLVPIEKQHPYFVKLNSDSAFTPAKSIINAMMPHFVDIDGNFVEQFQTTGFDSRLWELYLNSYFSEEQLFIDRTRSAPDFMLQKYGKLAAVEAVIVGRSEKNEPKYFKLTRRPNVPDVFTEQDENAIAIKYGSPLFSKLKKKYWELEHVRGNPLIFAIADFHDDQSMLWTTSGLLKYLYGFKHSFHYDQNNQLIISPVKIEAHVVGAKEIPSGFFFQPDANNVSAVLFSASGTISKFNRLGKQAGFGDPNIIMIRTGTYHDHDPNASFPKFFKYKVDETCHETWGEGASMYHNPNALYPVHEELFPSIAHHHFRDGQIVSRMPDFHPYASFTLNIRRVKKTEE